MQGYKVVREYNGLYWSVFNKYVGYVGSSCEIAIVPDTTCMLYPLNKWIRRKKDWGPITLFRDLDFCRKWFGDELKFAIDVKYVIFRCEYKESTDSNIWLSLNNEPLVRKDDLPKGTVLANRVKLLEEV